MARTGGGSGHGTLDEQDRIAILQMLTLTMDERLDYFADEVEFERADVEWADG